MDKTNILALLLAVVSTTTTSSSSFDPCGHRLCYKVLTPTDGEMDEVKQFVCHIIQENNYFLAGSRVCGSDD